jgi:cytochrome c peroxidase
MIKRMWSSAGYHQRHVMQRTLVVASLCFAGLFGLWQGSQGIERKDAMIPSQEPIQPIPLHIELDPKKVALGEKLFHDPRLSHDNSLACASCHNLATGGADHKVRSLGRQGAEGPINTPTVFNSGFNFRQFWDGRAATLEEQMDGPVHNPKEMGTNWREIVGKLKNIPEYVTAFTALYRDGLQPSNIKDAIATFERALYTPNARFDKYLRGDTNAITAAEKAGYELFKSVGCIACHQGIGVGGNMFQVFGVLQNYFADRGNITQADLGRFNVTGDAQDRHVFKVPSLRNVAVTPPYLHDGSVDQLEEMVAVMAKYQLGRTLPPEETELIVMFLKTLTGEYKGTLLTLPEHHVEAK